jgi:sugar phosphate isomerase/epimerase
MSEHCVNGSRRRFLGAAMGGVCGVSAMKTLVAAEAASEADGAPGFRYALNMGTIRGQGLDLAREIDVAADAGYDAIEPWLGAIRGYVEKGGTTADLKKRCEDRGITVESAIGFAPWMSPDAGQRKAAFEAMRSDMDLVARIGGTRIAAPPAGATSAENLDLAEIAQWYAQLLELGAEMGVRPQLELWGPSKTLHRIGEAAHVAAEAGRDDACLLLDVYHIYKGGSDFTGLGMLNGRRMFVFHMNDYPADPSRENISDADRVYPGDGVAPMGIILRTLYETGFRGVLSLELFNREYWKQDATAVAKTGLAKMKAAVERAFS